MPDIATAVLIRKRAELAGEIEALDATLSQLRADLVHLDAAIRIMSPDTDPGAIRPRKPSRKGCDWFGRGELARMVLDVLPEAQGGDVSETGADRGAGGTREIAVPSGKLSRQRG